MQKLIKTYLKQNLTDVIPDKKQKREILEKMQEEKFNKKI